MEIHVSELSTHGLWTAYNNHKTQGPSAAGRPFPYANPSAFEANHNAKRISQDQIRNPIQSGPNKRPKFISIMRNPNHTSHKTINQNDSSNAKTSLSRIDQSPQPLHTRHCLLQPLKTTPLLIISTLQHRNPLLQLRARLALLCDHLVRLAEQLHRQLLQLRVRLRQLCLSGLAQALFTRQGVL